MEEEELGTNPEDPDSDDDGLTDGEEVHDWQNEPLDSDTDAGGADDGAEGDRGSGPFDTANDVTGSGSFYGGACRGCARGTSGPPGSMLLSGLIARALIHRWRR